MKREVTFRQIAFMYLFISISPVFRQIPEALAEEAGRSGYLSPLLAIVPIIPLTAVMVAFLKAFPGLNFYEITAQLVGKIIAKIIVLGYLLWMFLLISTKVNAYASTLQFTLMPQTKMEFLIVILILLVYYGLIRGIKTIFRFTEFTLVPILLLFTVLLLNAIPKFRLDYLLPVTSVDLPSAIIASKQVVSIGGSIIFVLFFADKFDLSIPKNHIRKLWISIISFTLLASLITLFTFGITGAPLTARLPFPFYITVKSISLFNAFERFEILVTLTCMLSDFIAVSIFAVALLRCFEWLFDLKQSSFLCIPLTIVLYYLTFYISKTQFEFSFLYRVLIVNVNLIFQYLVPAFLALVCLLRRKSIRKQY